MFEPIIKMIATVAAAGVIALAVTAALAANELDARGEGVQDALTQPFAKADRLRVPVRETACMQQNWPNLEPKCQFDIRETAGNARAVRVIALR
jgi:hypothetical protein